MAGPRDNAKKTGDIHLPEVESDLPMQEGTGVDMDADSTPGAAGVPKDRDAPTSDSSGQTRDSGAGGGRDRG